MNAHKQAAIESAEELVDDAELAETAAAQAAKSMPKTADLSRVGELVEEALACDRRLADLAETIKTVEERQRRILNNELPELMGDTLNMKSFALADGTSVEILQFVDARITEATKEAAFAWLKEHKLDDIIKREVKVAFGRGEGAYAKKLLDFAATLEHGSAETTAAVHYQTLKALIKTRLEAGQPVPTDTFNVYVGRVAKIKLPKQPKKG